jgi:hypothetical protein
MCYCIGRFSQEGSKLQKDSRTQIDFSDGFCIMRPDYGFCWIGLVGFLPGFTIKYGLLAGLNQRNCTAQASQRKTAPAITLYSCYFMVPSP